MQSVEYNRHARARGPIAGKLAAQMSLFAALELIHNCAAVLYEAPIRKHQLLRLTSEGDPKIQDLHVQLEAAAQS